MTVSPYSIVMALLWFTITALIGSFILRRAEKYGLVFVSAIFLCSLLRCVLPLDYAGSIIIRSAKIYPMLVDLFTVQIHDSITVGHGLFALWGVGAVFCLLRFFWKLLWQTKRLRTIPNEGPVGMLSVLLEEVCGELGYQGSFRLTVSANVSTAYQAGFFRPHILLPIEAYAFPDEDLRNIFRHELCHFLGRDLWVKSGMKALSCFLWWNPVVFLLNRNVVQLLELNCDRRACKELSPTGQLDYLNTLLRFAATASIEGDKVALSYLGNTEKFEIQQRFQFMLQDRGTKHSRLKLVGYCVLCAGLFVASYCVILQPHTEPPTLSDSMVNASVDTDSDQEGFVLQRSDGIYEFYVNGVCRGTLSEGDLCIAPYNELPLYEEGSD